jgi:hypothetical protein
MKAKYTGKDFNVLSDYGYVYSMEDGWISANRATVVSEIRKPYREIKQYTSGRKKAHEKNITTLVDAGLAKREEG